MMPLKMNLKSLTEKEKKEKINNIKILENSV